MKYIQILPLALLIFSCSQPVEDKPTYLTEKIEYASKNILGFENLFGDGLNAQKNLEIFGVMHFPDNYDLREKYPAIVASHG